MASIERLLDRKVERGRVHYLVRWAGHTADQDTWESRVDLRQDGHFEHVRAYEAERKANGTTDEVKAESKPRGRSRSTKSKSPARGRSRSVSKKEGASPRGRSRTRANSVHREKKAPVTIDTTQDAEEPKPTVVAVPATTVEPVPVAPVASATDVPPAVKEVTESIFAEPVARSLPAPAPLSDPANDADDENDIFNKEAVQQQIDAISSGEYDNVSKMIDALRQQGWLYRFAGFIVVFLAMLANVMIPAIEQNFPVSDESKLALAILTKTNALPPLICLLLVLSGQTTRSLSKWIAICLVWRTAAEVVLQLPDPMTVYATVVLACLGIADFFAFVAVCGCVGGSQPREEVFTQTLCAMGTVLLVASDCILTLGLLPETSMRFIVMSFGTVLLAFSSVLAEAE
ncbi:hypothetical protein ACHHYP_13650 [Achlya hypogyna]|uniref:Chromo domain-containing protein n=1 Tax=Achlya hypogyna TaxID=1202772 RepID=A0A1V9ZFI6_ACHHY|nr:hypothetical protein ACHHYP_13650 [Achlya hypogyna]